MPASPLSSPRLLRRPRATLVATAVTAVTAAGAALALAGCGVLGGGVISTIGEVEFDTPLAIPPLASSTIDAQGRRVFELTAHQASTDFLPGGATTTWGFASAGTEQS